MSGGEKRKTTEEEEEEEQGDEEVDCFFFLCFVFFFCGCCGALCVESEEYNLPAGEKLALSFFVSLFYKVLSLLLLRGRKERSVVVSFFLSFCCVMEERVGGAMATGAAATVEGGERGGEAATVEGGERGGEAATVEGGERGGELAAAASSVNGRKGGGERVGELAAAASSVDGRKGGGEGNNNNNNNNAGGGAAAAGGSRMAQFLEVYQQLKKELLSDSDLFQYTTESRSWVEEASHTQTYITFLSSSSFCRLASDPSQEEGMHNQSLERGAMTEAKAS